MRNRYARTSPRLEGKKLKPTFDHVTLDENSPVILCLYLEQIATESLFEPINSLSVTNYHIKNLRKTEVRENG